MGTQVFMFGSGILRIDGICMHPRREGKWQADSGRSFRDNSRTARNRPAKSVFSYEFAAASARPKVYCMDN
ncbi:hypothetical protein [Fertoeibacter niger]|uniref:hypothetical protein n=1 Tax=Fertoeibacter niger TaxID=2656921 RepID=UPI00157D477F|nr:hypothetical protein [Fertoeibacter niger]